MDRATIFRDSACSPCLFEVEGKRSISIGTLDNDHTVCVHDIVWRLRHLRIPKDKLLAGNHRLAPILQLYGIAGLELPPAAVWSFITHLPFSMVRDECLRDRHRRICLGFPGHTAVTNSALISLQALSTSELCKCEPSNLMPICFLYVHEMDASTLNILRSD